MSPVRPNPFSAERLCRTSLVLEEFGNVIAHAISPGISITPLAGDPSQ